MKRKISTIIGFSREDSPIGADAYGPPDRRTALIVLTACDDNHSPFALTLVRSLDAAGEPARFNLHLVNPDDQTIADATALAKRLEVVDLCLSVESTDLSNVPEGERPTYYASARFLRAQELLAEHRSALLVLDSDSLFVRPIDFDFTDKINADVCIHRRDLAGGDVDHRLAVANGAIFLANSARTRIFLGDIAEELAKRVDRGQLPWYTDQELVYRYLVKYQPKLRLFNIKRKYIDWAFNPQSILWSAKGQLKSEDLRYRLGVAALSGSAVERLRSAELIRVMSQAFAEQPQSMAILRHFVEYSRRVSEMTLAARLSHVGGRFRSLVLTTPLRLRQTLNLETATAQRQPPPTLAPAQDTVPVRPAEPATDIAIFLPRLDLPWGARSPGTPVPPLSADVLDLRLNWKKFCVYLANAFEGAGQRVQIIEIPNGEITPAHVDAANARIAFVPHRCRHDFTPGETPVRFYMQEYFRWCFVVDEGGWSASSSLYPFDDVVTPVSSGSFERYRRNLEEGRLASKFKQKERTGEAGRFAGQDYIFFPLQIPHDQSIAYFSDVSEDEVVASLAAWARAAGRTLVLKPHPANMKATSAFRKYVDDKFVFWCEDHVHDLIAGSAAVFTMNSGVGFEAILHVKPIVTFARVDYDSVTIHGRLDALDEAWAACQASSREELEDRYRTFFDWFMTVYAFDMSDPKKLRPRCATLADALQAQPR